jgi:hypothetical protein
VRRVVVAAIDGTRGDDCERRLAAQHLADLHGRGVRAQQRRARVRARRLHDEERVLHVGRRVIGRKPEAIEVVLVQVDLGAVRDVEAEADEQVEQLVLDPRERMRMTEPSSVSGQRDVQRRTAKLRVASSVRERSEPRVERGLDLQLQLVRALAELTPLLLGQLGHELHQLREQPGWAREARVRRAQRRLVACGLERSCVA